MTKATVEASGLEDLQVRERAAAHPEGNYIPYEIAAPSEIPAYSPFGGPHLVRLTTSSHTKQGYLTKDSESIRKHNEHLAAKIHDHLDEITLVMYDRQPGAETLVISYGIMAKAVEAAVLKARTQGQSVSSLVIHSLWPVPEKEIRAALAEAKRVIIPELNLGLYRREIERLTGDRHGITGITRLDGNMISPDQILGVIQS